MNLTEFFKKTIIVILISLYILLVFIYVNKFFPILDSVFLSGDQARSAVVGKNIADGKGYTTNFLPLSSLDFYEKKGLLHEPQWQNADRFPLGIYLTSVIYSFFNSHNHLYGTALYGLIIFLLTQLVIFWFSYRLFRKYEISFLTILLITFSPEYLQQAFIKSADDTLFLVLTIWLSYEFINKPNKLKAILVGLSTGILFLARSYLGIFSLLASILISYWYFYQDNRSLKQYFNYISIILIFFILVLIPYGYQSYQTWSIPFFSVNGMIQVLQDTPLIQNMNPWWRLNIPEDFSFQSMIIHNFDILLSKQLGFIKGNFFYFLLNWNIYLILLLLLIKVNKKNINKNVFWLPANMLFIIFIFSIFSLGIVGISGAMVEYFTFLIPICSMYASAALYYCRNNLREASLIKVENRFFLFLLLCICLGLLIYYARRFAYPALQNFNLFIEYMILFIAFFMMYLFLLSTWLFNKYKKFKFFLLILAISITIRGIPDWEKFNDRFLPTPNNSALEYLAKNTKEEDIILMLNGFPSLFWMGIQGKTLPVPENPLYIYTLIKDYALPVKYLYLDGARDWLEIVKSPATMQNYALINEGKIPIFNIKPLIDINGKSTIGRNRNISLYELNKKDIEEFIRKREYGYKFASIDNRLFHQGLSTTPEIIDNKMVLPTTAITNRKKPKKCHVGLFLPTDKKDNKRITVNLYSKIQYNIDILFKPKLLKSFMVTQGWNSITFDLTPQMQKKPFTQICMSFSNYNMQTVSYFYDVRIAKNN